MLLRGDEEVDKRDPDGAVLRKVEGDHEIILVQHLRPNRAVNDPTEALGQVSLPDATGSPAIYHRLTPSVMAASQRP